jgi:hypothetical protein
MKQSSIQIDRENRTVTIIMPLEKPRPSKSTGKTRVIASTGGLKISEESYARRLVCFTANVFFFPTNSDENGQHSAGSEEAQRSTKRSRDRRRDLATTGGSAGSTKA